jgi:hypothetical protein
MRIAMLGEKRCRGQDGYAVSERRPQVEVVMSVTKSKENDGRFPASMTLAAAPPRDPSPLPGSSGAGFRTVGLASDF